MADTARKKIAVVGAGYFSQFHLEGWKAMECVEVAGLCDRDVAKAEILARRFGIARVFGNVSELIDATGPDLVDIVTPPASHEQVVSTVLGAGIAAICQKPFGLHYAQALRMVEAAEARGVPLVVHENFRFMPWFRELRRLIDSDWFGRLHGISFRLRPGDGQGARAYLDRQPYFQSMPRLLVVETAVHLIDTFRFLVGEVEAVYARLRRLNPCIAGEDAGIIVFEFEGGAAGLFDGNRLNDHVAENPRRTMGEMWLEGERGVMRLDGEARLWWKPHHGPEAEHAYPRGSAASFGGGACEALQRHVCEALQNAQRPENTARAYLANLRVQEAVYASNATGQRIVMSQFDPISQPSAISAKQPSKETT